jgi:hypothetical protein
MNRNEILTRVALFIVWPLLACVMLVMVAVLFVAVWPLLLTRPVKLPFTTAAKEAAVE